MPLVPCQARPGQPDTLSSLGITESSNRRIVEARILPNRRIARRVRTIRRDSTNPDAERVRGRDLLTGELQVEIQVEILNRWRYAAITEGCCMTYRDKRHQMDGKELSRDSRRSV